MEGTRIVEVGGSKLISVGTFCDVHGGTGNIHGKRENNVFSYLVHTYDGEKYGNTVFHYR